MPEIKPKALIFDCYGTLIDWETGIWDAFQPALLAAGRSDITRPRLLAAYAEAESRIEAEHPALPYDEVLRRVHEALTVAFSLANITRDMHTAFARSLPHWPAFPDSADALRALKEAGFKLFILSNVHEAGIAESVKKLGIAFDGIFTAEKIGTYKPDLNNFRYALEKLEKDFDIERDDVLHVAQSLFHDIAPARHLKLRCAWIDRQGLRHGGDWGATSPVENPPQPDFVFDTLADLAGHLGAMAPSS